MKHRCVTHPRMGECLYATNGIVEVYIPLSYGIRIGHFSPVGGENVFFEQPRDMTELTNPSGWRHWGGHRFWITPEDDNSYFPDNAPISYAIEGESILLMQAEDPWLRVKKSIRLTFGEDASVQVTHRLENTDTAERICALWAISAMAGGGTARIPAKGQGNPYQPNRNLALWNYTNPSDPRMVCTSEEIRLNHSPLPENFKIGIGHPTGTVEYENKGVVFQKDFPVCRALTYPDQNVSFEVFMCRHMIELESLSPLMDIPAGECREYTEIWRLEQHA